MDERRVREIVCEEMAEVNYERWLREVVRSEIADLEFMVLSENNPVGEAFRAAVEQCLRRALARERVAGGDGGGAVRGPGPSDRRSNCDHPVRAHGRDGAGSMSADLRLDSWLAEHYPELLVTLLRARERGDFLTVAEIEAAWVRALISAYLSSPKRSRKNSLSISSGSTP